MKPFLKWAGGKYRLIDRIKAQLPPGRRLVEPFVGSGAVFLNVDYPEYLLSDSNADLINLYRILQKEGARFVDYCREYFTPETNQEAVYYRFRSRFNHPCSDEQKAALFLYLNRHCYNGLCRYNASGKFNTPFGRYKKPYFPEREMLFFARKSRNAHFVCRDFRELMAELSPGDVVYGDPPYVPLSATADFTEYSRGGFNMEEQKKLAGLAVELAGRGIPVLLSNHDTDFVRQLYREAQLTSFQVQRFISAKGNNRKKAAELLAMFSKTDG